MWEIINRIQDERGKTKQKLNGEKKKKKKPSAIAVDIILEKKKKGN